MSEKKPSYNQVINEWQRREGFGWKLRNRWLVPYSGLPGTKKVIGWIWRLGVVFLGPLVLFSKCTESRLDSDQYSNSFARGLGEALGAEVEMDDPIRWGTAGPSIGKRLRVTWPEGSPIAMAEAYSTIIGGISKRERLGCSWDADNLDIVRLELIVDGADPERIPLGNQTLEVAHENLPARPTLLAAGFLQPPAGGRWTFQQVRVQNFNIRWGQQNNRGEILDSRVDLRKKDGKWVGTLTGGTLVQNWVHVKLGKADLSWDGNTFSITNGTLAGDRMGGSFSATVSSDLMGTATFEVENYPTALIIPGTFAEYVTGDVNGKIEVEGSLRGEAEVVAKADLTPGASLTLAEPNFLYSLSRATLNDNFARMPLEEGTIQLETGGGDLRNLEYELVCKDFGVLRGNASFVDRKFNGEGRLGIEPHVFRRIPLIQEKFFAEKTDELVWAPFTLEGPVNKWMEATKLSIESEFRSNYGDLP